MESEEKAGIPILLVDSDKLIRSSFARELREEGFTVTAVASGSQAIDEVKKEQFDLVVTDLMLPDIDGFAVLKAVKKHSPHTGLIILTSYTNMPAITEALRLGADDFTLKPCEMEELVFRIRRCLERKDLLQKIASRDAQRQKNT